MRKSNKKNVHQYSMCFSKQKNAIFHSFIASVVKGSVKTGFKGETNSFFCDNGAYFNTFSSFGYGDSRMEAYESHTYYIKS